MEEQSQQLLINLIEGKRPAKDILQYVKDNLLVDDHQMVKLQDVYCLAAHYDHRDLILEMSRRKIKCEVNNPLITAAANTDLDMATFLLNLDYPKFRSDTRGCGFIKDNKVTNRVTTAMEVAVANNNDKLMNILWNTYKSECVPLSHLVVHYNASQCFKSLIINHPGSLEQQNCSGYNVVHQAANSASLEVLQELVNMGASGIYEVTSRKHNVLHLTLMPARNPSECPVHGNEPQLEFPSDLVEKLEFLIERGARLNDEDGDRYIPLTVLFQTSLKNMFFVQQNWKVIHEATQILLLQMVFQNEKMRNTFVVPRSTLNMILTCAAYNVHTAQTMSVGLNQYLASVCELSKVLLAAGADINCDTGAARTHLDSFLLRFRDHTHSGSKCIVFIHDYLKTGLQYGGLLSESCFPALSEIQTWPACNLKDKILTLCMLHMPSSTYEEYKAYMKVQGHTNYLPPEIRTLAELCRVKIYNAGAPNRDVASILDEIKLPPMLLKYLMFDSL